ncbi:hypothetical protein OEZ86_005449 [Tetradesmus obliquus]|nr:hypothetical protein OEZ86_005449 [Tetradesmus obliquus]
MLLQQQQQQQQDGKAAASGLQQQRSLWRLVIRQLVESEVKHEMKGAIGSVGGQLCRAITAAAALSIKDHRLWLKLRSMTQGLAPLLDPSEVARCAWGLARSRIAPKSGACGSGFGPRVHHLASATAAAAAAAGDRLYTNSRDCSFQQQQQQQQ